MRDPFSITIHILILFFSATTQSVSLFAQSQKEEPLTKIAFISDTQAPMWVEEIFLKSNNNEKATIVLMNDILLTKPSAVFIPGDVVNLSCNKKKWVQIDSSLGPIRNAGIPVYALLGNHELMKRKKKGEENFQLRFPEHINTGYVIKQDSIAVIMLNSNFSKMKKEKIILQNEWYMKTLKELDTTSQIKVIVVSCHHSPYSDSKMVGSNKDVQDKFVPGFIESKKCKLFITGHAHLFQHFKVMEKDFLVIGGGGGLNHPLKRKSCGQVDLAKDYKPMFQYITLSLYSNRLEIISNKLKADFSGVEEGRTIQIGLEEE